MKLDRAGYPFIAGALVPAAYLLARKKAAIGVPLLGILFLILTKLLKGLRELTGYQDDDLMMPR